VLIDFAVFRVEIDMINRQCGHQEQQNASKPVISNEKTVICPLWGA
jgi:nitrite reductase/ring-hydroxylating ferredoxin subunit